MSTDPIVPNELHERLREFLLLADHDVKVCGKYMQAGEEQQFWRRTLYRCVFASMESIVSILKQSTALMVSVAGRSFLAEELLLLREIECELDDSGSIKEKKAKIRFLPNLQFALLAYSRAIGSSIVVEKNSGWDALTKSVKVRDRITHPKSKESLIISDVELKLLENGWDWFVEHFGKALNAKKG